MASPGARAYGDLGAELLVGSQGRRSRLKLKAFQFLGVYSVRQKVSPKVF